MRVTGPHVAGGCRVCVCSFWMYTCVADLAQILTP